MGDDFKAKGYHSKSEMRRKETMKEADQDDRARSLAEAYALEQASYVRGLDTFDKIGLIRAYTDAFLAGYAAGQAELETYKKRLSTTYVEQLEAQLAEAEACARGSADLVASLQHERDEARADKEVYLTAFEDTKEENRRLAQEVEMWRKDADQRTELVIRLQQERDQLRDQLLKDIESGFMPGAYARLKSLQEAEAEMYRLRAEVEHWKAEHAQRYAKCDYAESERSRLSAEVERLRGELTGAEEGLAEWIAAYQAERENRQHAEDERKKYFDKWQAERAEVERLQGELKHIESLYQEELNARR